MAAITIRNVDHAIKVALRVRAAQHGVSMEEEVRRILREALVRASSPTSMGQRLLQRFESAVSEDLVLAQRQLPRVAPHWE